MVMGYNIKHSLERLRSVIRAYDIRGIVPTALDENDTFVLGCVLACYIASLTDDFAVIIGMDNRQSSAALFDALKLGLQTNGLKITTIGIVPTPVLYYASFIQNKKTLGIMLTASHNPAQYNGFKVIFNGKILDGKALENAINLFDNNFEEALNINDDYLDYVFSATNLLTAQPKRAYKILWDCNNGATQEIIKALINKLPYDEINHTVINQNQYITTEPDPTNNTNIDRVRDIMLRNTYDIAFCFDGDGDRLVIITQDGNVLRGDKILLLHAQYHVGALKGGTIVVDIKTSDIIIRALECMDYKVIVQKTGHSFIKQMMFDKTAVLGGEVSGHLFFPFKNAEQYIAYDDAILAACHILYILMMDDVKCIQSINLLPQTICDYDIKIPCTKHVQLELLVYLRSLLENTQLSFSDIDGIKHTHDNGWWLIRSSNTENALIICIESYNVDNYIAQCLFIKNILNYFNLNDETLTNIKYAKRP